MMEPPSFQDIMAEFADEGFVGRDEYLEVFKIALTTPRPSFLIFSVSGQGGVGKSTLLGQFRHLAAQRAVPTALVNEDETSIALVLARFAAQFSESGLVFKTFDERYRRYRVMKDEVESDPDAPKGLLDFAVRSATRIGVRSLRRIPIAGEAGEVLLGEEGEDKLAEGASRMTEYLSRKFANKDERILLTETGPELTRNFLTDLNQFAATRRILLFFDTYEKTGPYLDDWLQKLLKGTYGKFSGNVLFVIAGRYPLTQTWTAFNRGIRSIGLDPFTEQESKEYLARFEIKDEAQVKQYFALSRGLPILLALLTSTPGTISSDHTGDAVGRFLQGATEVQRNLALTMCVPRYFNYDTLSVIHGPLAPNAFEWLTSQPFVSESKEGWGYHDVVRSLMLRYYQRVSSNRVSELHRELSEYYQTQAQALGLPKDKCCSNGLWQARINETIYHRLSSNPSKEVGSAFSEWLEIMDYLEYEGSDEEGDAAILMFAPTFIQVAQENDDPLLQERTAQMNFQRGIFTD